MALPPLHAIPHDLNKEPSRYIKRIQYPYFSPYPHTWEIDIVFVNKEKGFVRDWKEEQELVHRPQGLGIVDRPPQRFTQYLFCINVNTKFLVVFPLRNKSAKEIADALLQLINEVTVKHLRGDKEPAFRSFLVMGLLKAHHITSYWTDAPFTNHNRIVDRLIKGFRQLFAYHEGLMTDYTVLGKLVEEYNRTPHQAYRGVYSPLEAESNINIEGAYIRHEKKLLEIVEVRQRLLNFRGPHGYTTGNILLLHMDFGRTDQKHLKTHGIWYNGIGIFLKFVNRNVEVWHLAPSAYTENPILISLSFTKRLALTWLEIPDSYAQFFNIPIQYENVFITLLHTIHNKTGILIPIPPHPFPHPAPPLSDAEILRLSALQHQAEEDAEYERLADERQWENKAEPDVPSDIENEDENWDELLQRRQSQPSAQEPIVISDGEEEEHDEPPRRTRRSRRTTPIIAPRVIRSERFNATPEANSSSFYQDIDILWPIQQRKRKKK
jgi:hypothetical protein